MCQIYAGFDVSLSLTWSIGAAQPATTKANSSRNFMVLITALSAGSLPFYNSPSKPSPWFPDVLDNGRFSSYPKTQIKEIYIQGQSKVHRTSIIKKNTTMWLKNAAILKNLPGQQGAELKECHIQRGL